MYWHNRISMVVISKVQISWDRAAAEEESSQRSEGQGRRQVHSLCLAYERLDGQAEAIETHDD